MFSSTMPLTTIYYKIPEFGNIHLWIEKSCENEHVVTLIDSIIESGSYQISWDLKYDNGDGIQEGEYLVKLIVIEDTFESSFVYRIVDISEFNQVKPYAISNNFGEFSISQQYLPLDLENYSTNEFGDILDSMIDLSRNLKLKTYHDSFLNFSSSNWINVDEQEGVEIIIELGGQKMIHVNYFLNYSH